MHAAVPTPEQWARPTARCMSARDCEEQQRDSHIAGADARQRREPGLETSSTVPIRGKGKWKSADGACDTLSCSLHFSWLKADEAMLELFT